MQPKRPLILLDVDGVVNAVGPKPKTFDDWNRSLQRGFLITYSRTMADRLAALDAEIVWLTTWQHDANVNIGSLFDWPMRRVLCPTREEWGTTGWWKSTVAERAIAKHDGPFVWIDDDLADAIRRGEVAWLEDCAQSKMLVTPETQTGITPAMLDEIEAFVARCHEIPDID